MLSPLRNRFGIPGVVSVIALVFAMLGGGKDGTNGKDGVSTETAHHGRSLPPGLSDRGRGW